ncbi:MAG: TonB-dependent receptor [Chitinophagaceae bacterium]|nr:TonB-dependent receptor [Chitinophagaceae bacterium]
MKLSAILIVVGCLQVSARTYSQNVTLSSVNAPLEVVFREIEKQTGYHFFYRLSLASQFGDVNVHLDNVPVEEAMNRVLYGLPLQYRIVNKTIVVTEKPVPKPVITTAEPVLAGLNISGTVTDRQQKPLAGASIKIKGTGRGTLTDERGAFSLNNVDEAAILAVSYVGFQNIEVPVSGRSVIHIVMQAVETDLADVVVVGYGTQRRSAVTAAVSTLKGKEMTSIPITNLSNGLGGRMPGVIVKQTTGEPGKDGSNIFIRGISTTGANQPLLIVDGVPRDFQKLDPNTIESFTVLKDAAAVAPYGVAGANGVILVTTKRGKAGKPALNYNGYIGFQNPTVLPNYVNGYEYALLKNMAANNEGNPKPYTDEEIQKFKDGSDPDAYPSNSPYDGILTKNALLHSHSFDISGGSDRFRYYAGFGYQFQEGMWKTTDANRYNLALNLDAEVTPTTTVSFNVNGNVQQFQAPPSDLAQSGTSRIFELVGYAHPGFGGPHFFSNGMYGTHVAAAIFGSGYNKTNATNIFSQLSVLQKLPFVQGLSLKGTVAYDPAITSNKIWTTPLHVAALDKSQTPYVIKDGIFGATKAALNQQIAQSNQLTFQGELNYAKKMGMHNISAVGVFEARANSSSSLGASRRNYNLMIDEIGMGSSSAADMTTTGLSGKARQVGLVYRVAYDYAGKYLIETSGRYDGHYYFAPDRRWGYFPSASIGWRISEENFIKDNFTWLTNLKLRASYGEVGALAGSPFQYLSTYNVSGPGYAIGGSGVQIVTERAEPNPFITWERARKTDIGMELSLWKGLLEFEIDYFHEKRSNMLVSPSVVVPVEYGIGLSQVNSGVMQNNGIEFSGKLNYTFTKDLQASLGGTFTYAHNKLLQVFETAATFDNPNRRRTGRPLGMQFGYEAIGYFLPEDFEAGGALKPGIATQPWGQVKPGDLRYLDANKDGKIDVNDQVPIGDPSTPQIIYGISPSIRYKWISLDILFQGAAKTSFYYQDSQTWAFWNSMTAYKHNFDYWSPDNPDARFPRLTSAPTTNNSQVSSHWMQDVSYLRVKNITLAFTLSETLYSKFRISNAQVYFSAQNFLTWTKAWNSDPEMSELRGNSYPLQKVVSVGVRVGF